MITNYEDSNCHLFTSFGPFTTSAPKTDESVTKNTDLKLQRLIQLKIKRYVFRINLL